MSSSNHSSTFWRTARTNARLKNQFPKLKKAPTNIQLPLSLQQERLWYLEQLQPNTSVYNLLHIIRFNGSLEPTILLKTLQELSQRHQVLRTTFSSVGGEPFPIVADSYNPELPIVDLRSLPLAQREQEARKLALEEAKKPFELAVKPPWRVSLLRLDEDEYWLVRTVHHLIFDAWSHSVFMRELGKLYQDFSASQTPTLQEPLFQYVDFAYTQRQWMEESSFTTQLNYWQNHFSEPIASLQLPTDYPSTSLSSYEGKCQHLVCSPELTKSLKSLSYQQGVSLFATLLAAFKVLLYGYIRQENLLVCTPVAGRHGTETKNLIGYFNNMVMLKIDLSDNLSFTELVTQVGQVASDAYAHQNVPLQKLAELPQLAKTSLTKAMFVLQNIPHPSFEWEGLKITSEYVERPIANFDLSMSMEEKQGRLTGALQYKTALFEDVTISQMGENFQHLLKSIVANPEQPICSLASLIEKRESSVPKKTQTINHKQQESYIAPRNEIEVKLTKIWENVLDIQPIGVKDNFFSLGGYSLAAVSLFAQIEQQFAKKLPLTTLISAPTIEQLAKVLDPSEPKFVQDSLVLLKEGDNNPRLFLVHDGDGETILYLNLADCLQPSRPVYGLQPYAEEGYPMKHTRICEMATYYIEQIRRIQPEGPYLLGGLCAGGVIAFEMALQLQQQGQKVDLVALIDAADVEATQKMGRISQQRLSRFTKAFKIQQATSIPNKIIQIVKTVSKKVSNTITYELRTKIQNYGDHLKIKLFRYYLDRGILPPQFLQNIPVRSVYLFAEKEYRPQELYQGEVTLFLASQGEGEDEPYADIYIDPLLGWGKRVAQGVKVYQISGGHSSMLQAPHVQMMADAIQDYLNLVSGEQKAPVAMPKV